MNRERFFADIMDICNWDKQGDDEQVLMPLIHHRCSRGMGKEARGEHTGVPAYLTPKL